MLKEEREVWDSKEKIGICDDNFDGQDEEEDISDESLNNNSLLRLVAA